ncbi:MAG: gluconate 2-dehydrogenase subunit 3 family protein, partial [Gracilimonas sp.]
MNRREALKKLGIVVGGTVVGSQVLLMGCSSGRSDLSKTFSPENLKLLNEVGETIIPATKTAGAKAANVADFMKTIVTDFYTEEEQRVFAEGVIALNELAEKKYGG